MLSILLHYNQLRLVLPVNVGFVTIMVILCHVHSVNTVFVRCVCVNVTDALEYSVLSAPLSTMIIMKSVLCV